MFYFYDMARIGTFIKTLGRLEVARAWREVVVRVKESFFLR